MKSLFILENRHKFVLSWKQKYNISQSALQLKYNWQSKVSSFVLFKKYTRKILEVAHPGFVKESKTAIFKPGQKSTLV